MKIGPREQLILSIVGAVIVLVALAAILVYPQFQQLGELNTKIGAARQEADSAKAQLDMLNQSKSHAAETDAKWLRLANLVPDGPDLPSLIVELQDAAFASGVQLITVTPSTPSAASNSYTIPVSTQVIGTWADTVDFMQRIMRLDRGVRIVEVSSARTTNTDQAAHENSTLPDYALATTIKLETYMIPSSTPTATPTGAPTQVPASGN